MPKYAKLCGEPLNNYPLPVPTIAGSSPVHPAIFSSAPDRNCEQISGAVDSGTTVAPRKRDRRAYMRRYQSSWLRHRRAIAIDYLGGRCLGCGSTKRLEIHHRDPTQKVSHRIWGWAPQRLQAELAKCDLLCSRCHISRHAKERRTPIVHGTRRGYEKGCRCRECTDAKVAQVRRCAAQKQAAASTLRGGR